MFINAEGTLLSNESEQVEGWQKERSCSVALGARNDFFVMRMKTFNWINTGCFAIIRQKTKTRICPSIVEATQSY